MKIQCYLLTVCHKILAPIWSVYSRIIENGEIWNQIKDGNSILFIISAYHVPQKCSDKFKELETAHTRKFVLFGQKISETKVIDIKPIILKDQVMQESYTVIFSFSLLRSIVAL